MSGPFSVGTRGTEPGPVGITGIIGVSLLAPIGLTGAIGITGTVTVNGITNISLELDQILSVTTTVHSNVNSAVGVTIEALTEQKWLWVRPHDGQVWYWAEATLGAVPSATNGGIKFTQSQPLNVGRLQVNVIIAPASGTTSDATSKRGS
jgi:hypothetical protein